MKIDTRSMNQWAKEKMKNGYKLLLLEDKSFGYVRAHTDETNKNVVIINARNEQRRVLKEMEEKF
ncbi:hypothetical protein D3C81_797870 [compost metagenome]